MVRLNDSLNITIAVDWDVKPQTKQKTNGLIGFSHTGLVLLHCFKGSHVRISNYVFRIIVANRVDHDEYCVLLDFIMVFTVCQDNPTTSLHLLPSPYDLSCWWDVKHKFTLHQKSNFSLL